MYKPSTRKLLFIVGSLVIVLAAFLAGGIALSSVHAASASAASKSNVQSACDKQDPACQGNHQNTLPTRPKLSLL